MTFSDPSKQTHPPSSFDSEASRGEPLPSPSPAERHRIARAPSRPNGQPTSSATLKRCRSVPNDTGCRTTLAGVTAFRAAISPVETSCSADDAASPCILRPAAYWNDSHVALSHAEFKAAGSAPVRQNKVHLARLVFSLARRVDCIPKCVT